MHRVVALVLPEVVAFDLAIPAQVFGHADQRERYSFAACALTAGLVPSTTGFGVHVPMGLEALKSADTIVIPGYFSTCEPPEEVLHALRTAAADGVRLVSVCTGAFALAAAGLLDGRRATTHWLETSELASRYPAVDVNPDVLYIADDLIMTSAGIAAGIDLCLHVVRMDNGEHAAADVARRMVVAPHREGGQAQFLRRPIPAGGSGLAATCAWALERIAEPLSVQDLARHAGWAPRTFARHFVAETGTTPLRWLTAQRILEARRLLEVTDFTIDEIAGRTGLGTSANLRQRLAQDAGTTPTAYRRSYQGLLRSRQTGRSP